MTLDLDAIAREADPQYKGNQQSQFDSSCLPLFAALLLEKVADAANHEDHITVLSPDCGALQGRETQCSIVKELRRMSAALQSGDRGQT